LKISLFFLLSSLFFFFSLELYAQQIPFKGSPFAIPGKIEAEDFDKGGEGVAYHDDDNGNSGGSYRQDENVDIEVATEGHYNIGWIRPNEWTEYTVEIKQSGLYRIDVRVAASSSIGSFHLELDGQDFTGSIETPVTGGWQDWVTIPIREVYLSSGQKILRWFAETSGFNVNYFDFVLLAQSDPPTVTIITPEDKADFYKGDEIIITAEASDPDGSVLRVEFFANDAKIGQDATAPYSIKWTPAEIDKYDLVAVAYDDKGIYTVSKKVDITVHYPDLMEGPDFSAARGFYEKAFDLTISTAIEGAQIKYTVDGSDPMSSEKSVLGTSPVTVRVNPNSTQNRGKTPAFIVRAVAVAGEKQLTRVQTHTFIFIENVKTQRKPVTWPSSGVNDQTLKYNMSSEVVNSTEYKELIDDALLDIPSISISTDLDNLFDSETGIYVNAVEHGEEWERPASIELINPSGEAGFHVDAGLRIRGGYSRNDNNPKHAFRLFFREKYGFAKLQYPLFEDEGADEFDKVDLRCSQNYSWSYNHSHLNTATRDVFSRDLQREMGRPYTRSRYYHLYLDGMYWGLFETQERSEASFAKTYFGGSRNDYDVVKVDAGYGRPYTLEATDGNLGAWNQVWEACKNGFSKNIDYFKLQGLETDGSPDANGQKLVDIENLIDYMITVFHVGNFDAPVSKFSNNKNPNNFYAVYDRTGNDGFKFFAHDSEHSLLFDDVGPGEGIDENRVNIGEVTGKRKMVVDRFDKFHPQWLHFKLSDNAEYRQKFADHVYKHYFNDGILVPENASSLFMYRANMIDMAIIAESARWGSMSLSKNNAWLPTVMDIADNYFYERWDIVLDQYIKAGLYPNIDPPVFKSGGQEIVQQLVTVEAGYKLLITNPNGTSGSVYYTLDGSDPRNVGGAVASWASDGGDSKELFISSTTLVSARVKSGSAWSAMHQLALYVAKDAGALKITEIHYKPMPEGDISGREFEFIELKNTGSSTLDLGLALFIKGIQYNFPPGVSLPGGSFFVLASNAQAFEARYGFAPNSEFIGQLDNSGEKLVMVDALGDTIICVRYNDKPPWPEEPDSLGTSLVPILVNPTGDPNDPAYWQSSYWVGGSPGRDDKATTEVKAINKNPKSFLLLQNYPNPFNSETIIAFELPEAGHVELEVYDIRGRLVQKLFSSTLAPGKHKVTWSADKFAAGVYFYQMKHENGKRLVKKLVYVK